MRLEEFLVYYSYLPENTDSRLHLRWKENEIMDVKQQLASGNCNKYMEGLTAVLYIHTFVNIILHGSGVEWSNRLIVWICAHLIDTNHTVQTTQAFLPIYLVRRNQSKFIHKCRSSGNSFVWPNFVCPETIHPSSKTSLAHIPPPNEIPCSHK